MSGRHCLFAGIAALITLTGSAAPALAGSCALHVIAALPVTMRDARATVPVTVNGRDTEFWLDSGAWFSIMSKARASELALPLQEAPAGLYGIGIGGTHSLELARIKDFGIVGVTLHKLEFLVGGSDAGNALIGRNILGIADTEFDLAHGSVKLIRPVGCSQVAMAYWATGHAYFVASLMDTGDHMDFGVKAAVNGVPIKAEIDSGAPHSLLSQRAAERAGIDLTGPGVQPLDGMGGFGRKLLKGWSVPVNSVAIGEEQVLRTRLDVIEGSIAGGDGPEMLLGADFLLAHHVYVARAQNRIYFTYTGGKPFQSSAAAPQIPASPATATAAVPSPASIPAGAQRVLATDTAAEPKTADEFARRAAARLATGQATQAIADYTAAIALNPGNSALYRDRAQAYGAGHQSREARADFDKAIALSPTDPELIRMRAVLRHIDGDDLGALADADAAARVTHPATLDARMVAELYIELGHADRAIPLLDAMIAAHQADNRLPELYNSRCWSRALAMQALAGALDDCNRALKGRPGSAGILDSRALVRFRLRDYVGALADYDAALVASPQEQWSHYMRGLTRMALGQAEAGKAERDGALADSKTVAARARYYNLGP